VRLKDTYTIYESSCFTISIPFGAIKSPYYEVDAPEANLFQFLLVRLKVACGWIIVVFFRFQFLLVRLKAFASTELTAQNFISIPFGAIKRIAVSGGTYDDWDFNSFWCD